MTEKISLLVNGKRHVVSIEVRESLNYVLRERLFLLGTKKGCETGGCGSCTVLVDGLAVYSCMLYAMQAVGKSIRSVEGLASTDGSPSILQRSFMDAGGLQCGYCTPGFLMSAEALLSVCSHPTDDEIRDSLVGNLCRCTGYTKIFDAIKLAAAQKVKNKG